jgi:hypothetical protein
MAGYVAPTVRDGFDHFETIDVDIPVQFGAPFAVNASVTASSDASSFFGSVGAFADFGMIELFILGPDKVPLSDARYISASNAGYGFINAALIPIPEPSTAGLLFAGCSVGLLARRRYRTTAAKRTR